MSTVDAGSAGMVKWRKGDGLHMKKWLCRSIVLLIALTSLTGCSAKEKEPAAAPKPAASPLDPVLVAVDMETMPQGEYADLGGGRILVTDIEKGQMAIYHLHTGKSIPVTAREEDKEYLLDYHVSSMAADNEMLTLKEIDEIRQQYSAEDLLKFAVQSDMSGYIRSSGSNYAKVGGLGLLEIATGTLTPLPVIYVNTITPWDQLFVPAPCTLYGTDGQLLHIQHFDSTDHLPQSSFLVEDGVVALLGLTDRDNKQTHYQCVLLDRELNVRKTLDIGQHHNRWLSINQAYHSKPTGRLLLNTYGEAYSTKMKWKENGRWSVWEEPVGPYLDGLLVIDTTTGEVHRIAEDMYASIIGMASDGSYALFCDDIRDDPQVYKLDMETLTVTVQMTAAEVRDAFKPYFDAGYIFAPISLMTWDGGEYAVTPLMIFRVAERP